MKSYNEGYTFDQAQAKCTEKAAKELGKKCVGTLPNLQDYSTEDLTELRKEVPNGKFWVSMKGEGHSKTGDDADYTWSDGTVVTDLTGWHKEGTQTKGDCGLMMNTGVLNAVDCTYTNNLVC